MTALWQIVGVTALVTLGAGGVWAWVTLGRR